MVYETGHVRTGNKLTDVSVHAANPPVRPMSVPTQDVAEYIQPPTRPPTPCIIQARVARPSTTPLRCEFVHGSTFNPTYTTRCRRPPQAAHWIHSEHFQGVDSQRTFPGNAVGEQASALHAQGRWLSVSMASAPMFLLSQARANTLLKANFLIRCAARVKHALWVSRSALLMSWPSHNTSHTAPRYCAVNNFGWITQKPHLWP